MKDGSKERRRARIAVVCGLVFAFLTIASPVGFVVAEPAGDPGPIEATLARLSEILTRLEGELAALEAPRAERLEERLENVIELIEALLGELDRPREEMNEQARMSRIVVFALRLHRLVYLLEEIIEDTPSSPVRPHANRSVDDLKVWLDGLIFHASVGMSPEEYEQLESAVYRTARVLSERISEMAKRVVPGAGRLPLVKVVEHLEAVLFRLDGFILHHFPQRRA